MATTACGWTSQKTGVQKRILDRPGRDESWSPRLSRASDGFREKNPGIKNDPPLPDAVGGFQP
jgi:hypothetical protein